MDQMLPSPGFSIPSIGTPLHQPEEDQQIVATNTYYSQQLVNQNGMANSNNTPNSTVVGMSMNSVDGMGSNNGMGVLDIPSLPIAPTKLNSYQPSYGSSSQIQQPHTPVNCTAFYFQILLN